MSNFVYRPLLRAGELPIGADSILLEKVPDLVTALKKVSVADMLVRPAVIATCAKLGHRMIFEGERLEQGFCC